MGRKNTSDRLKELMSMNNWKQVDLIQKTRIPKSAISQYISGKRLPRQDKLTIIANACNVSEAWLMGYDVPMRKEIAEAHNAGSNNYNEFNAKGVQIPVLGKVAAGIPIEAIEDIVDWEEIPVEMAKKGDYFALSIKGDSMEPKMSEGDVVIVKKQQDVESGEVAIVRINGDNATCKRLLKSSDGFILISLNPTYAPMHYSNEDIENLPVEILGKVVELRAKF